MRKGLLLTFLIVLLTGCLSIPIGDGGSLKLSKDGFTVKDKDSDEEVSFGIKDGSFSFSTDEGDVSFNIGGNAEVPKSFPIKELPIPKEAMILSVMESNTETESGGVLSYLVSGNHKEVSKFYISHFEKNKFTVEESSILDATSEDSDSGFITILAEKGDKNYSVTIVGDGNEVSVTLTYGDNHE